MNAKNRYHNLQRLSEALDNEIEIISWSDDCIAYDKQEYSYIKKKCFELFVINQMLIKKGYGSIYRTTITDRRNISGILLDMIYELADFLEDAFDLLGWEVERYDLTYLIQEHYNTSEMPKEEFLEELSGTIFSDVAEQMYAEMGEYYITDAQLLCVHNPNIVKAINILKNSNKPHAERVLKDLQNMIDKTMVMMNTYVENFYYVGKVGFDSYGCIFMLYASENMTDGDCGYDICLTSILRAIELNEMLQEVIEKF